MAETARAARQMKKQVKNAVPLLVKDAWVERAGAPGRIP
jgi:hypothetical protein